MLLFPFTSQRVGSVIKSTLYYDIHIQSLILTSSFLVLKLLSFFYVPFLLLPVGISHFYLIPLYQTLHIPLNILTLSSVFTIKSPINVLYSTTFFDIVNHCLYRQQSKFFPLIFIYTLVFSLTPSVLRI